jgi:hypothetical protein
MTLCKDHTKSHTSVILGIIGKPDKNVLLELGPHIGGLQLEWQAGPELHIQLSESAIVKRYGPYENLPRVVITSP